MNIARNRCHYNRDIIHNDYSSRRYAFSLKIQLFQVEIISLNRVSRIAIYFRFLLMWSENEYVTEDRSSIIWIQCFSINCSVVWIECSNWIYCIMWLIFIWTTLYNFHHNFKCDDINTFSWNTTWKNLLLLKPHRQI